MIQEFDYLPSLGLGQDRGGTRLGGGQQSFFSGTLAGPLAGYRERLGGAGDDIEF